MTASSAGGVPNRELVQLALTIIDQETAAWALTRESNGISESHRNTPASDPGRAEPLSGDP